LDDAVFDQHHRRHRGKRFGHRVNAEDRIELHGRIRALVLEADGVRIDDLPLPAAMTTAPGNLPSAILFLSLVVMRPRRSADTPTCSGAAGARGWSSRAQTGSDTVAATSSAASAVVAASSFHRDMTFLP